MGEITDYHFLFRLRTSIELHDYGEPVAFSQIYCLIDLILWNIKFSNEIYRSLK